MRLFLAAALIAALAACQPKPAAPVAAPPAPPPAAEVPPPITTQPFDATNPTPSLTGWGFEILPIGDLGLTGGEDAAAIGELLKEKYGFSEPVEGAYSEFVIIKEVDAGARILFTSMNRPDDSVRTEQYLVEMFYPAATAAGVTGFGIRRQCWRAPDLELWTSGSCP